MKNYIKTLVLAGYLAQSTAYAHWQGFLLTELEHIDEVAEFTNAFAYLPNSEQELIDVLTINNGRMMPVIELGRYFWNADTGTYQWRDVSSLIAAIGKHQIIAEIDEPFWHIHQSCTSGKQSACNEIANGYPETQQVFRRLKYELGVQLVHIEAYTVLISHKLMEPDKPVSIIDAADHVGFDCYGDFDDCDGYSQTQYGMWIYEAVRGTTKKIFLVAGSFLKDEHFTTEQQVIDQMRLYFCIYRSAPDFFSALGLFLYADTEDFSGAKSHPAIMAEIINLLNSSSCS